MQRGKICAGVAVLTLMTGCGGTKSLSKAEFVKRADAVCARASKAAGSQADFVARMAAFEQKVEADLRTLKPPAELQRPLADYVGGLRQRDGLIRRYQAAAKARDSAQLHAVNQQGSAIGARLRTAVTALGIRACGE
jgi:hypothetical protein